MAYDPYRLLGVSRTASQDEIKNAYRKLARKLHPDLNPGNADAEKKFKEVSGAYDWIGSPEKREKFDRGEIGPDAPPPGAGPGGFAGEGGFAGAGGFGGRPGAGGPFYYETQSGPGGRYSRSFSGFDEDLFENLFGGGAGRDEIFEMEVDFKDAALGAEREITLPSGKRLRVRIPSGISSGQRLRFAGQGGAAMGRGRAGDLYIVVGVRESERFKRVDRDVLVDLPVSLPEAVLGAEIRVPTLEGAVMMKIPAGVNTDRKLRLKGKGIRDAKSGARGDQIVNVKVMLPRRIDPELEESIRRWSATHGYDPRGGEAKKGSEEEAA